MTVITVTDQTFDDVFSKTKFPVILQIVGPTKKSDGSLNSSGKMVDVFDKLAEKYDGKITALRMELVAGSSVAKRYNVNPGDPSTLVYMKTTQLIGYYNDGRPDTLADELLT